MDDVEPHRHHYRLAGISITSDFALPEAAASDGSRGVGPEDTLVVLDGRRHDRPRPADGNARTADAQRARFDVPGIGRFLVESGRRVVVWPETDVSPEALSQQIGGPAFALALMQRGMLVLHGAVVVVDGRAVILLGHTGDGKSTTAAACAARGHHVASDDLAIVEAGPTGFTVRAVSSLVRMTDPSTVPDAAGVAWRAADKDVRVFPDAPRQQRVPIGGLAGLHWTDVLDVRAVAPVEAALLLLEHAFCRPAFGQPQAAAALDQSSALASSCPVWRFGRPRRLDALPEVVDSVERAARRRDITAGVEYPSSRDRARRCGFS